MNASNNMDTNLTGMWVSFFTASGIPSDVSATYALTFAENRIQSDMLLDLNKEYLRDMGIVRMGDVIAILRHAKQVHESAARDKVLSTTAVKVPVAAVTGRSTLTQPSSPASRILEHYTRNPNSPETSPANVVKLKRKPSSDIGTITDTKVPMKKTRLIRFESPTRPAAAPKETATKQTVFSRLGNSDVVKAASPKPAAKQIFLRLGSKTEEKDEQDIPIPKDALKYEGILKSSPPGKVLTKKVFTVTTNKNNQRKIAIATMRADETPVSVKEKLALPKAKSVKFSNQVQYKEIETNKKVAVPIKVKSVQQKFTPVFNKPERRLSMPEAESGVKARLGTKSTKSFTITRNVFNRLGA
ncbi:uncharacterized protein [Epargyreus clarus]|uniref:uncharacterized protein n=1 Tax=Epargyreus clarus TaxID=520877 RepID=UPI003C2AC91B